MNESVFSVGVREVRGEEAPEMGEMRMSVWPHAEEKNGLFLPMPKNEQRRKKSFS